MKQKQLRNETEYGIEVELINKDTIIIETLERLGISDNKLKILYPSCYLLKYDKGYRILHFKEFLELDGNQSTFTEEDKQRRDSIIHLLEKWHLVKAKEPLISKTMFVFVLRHEQLKDWKIIHKYKRVFNND